MLACGVVRRAIALGLALTASACGGSTATTSVAGPSGVRCQATVTAQPLVVPSDGGSVQITIASNRDCSWNASSEASWIQLSATAGQGEAAIVGSVTVNEQPVARAAGIVVNDQRFTVSQEPRPCRYELRQPRADVPATGGRGTVELTTLPGCPWTANSNAQWLQVLMPSGTGSAAIEFEASAAEDGGAREAVITIADLRFIVEQQRAAGAPSAQPQPPPPAPPPPPPPCTLRVAPGSQTIDLRGGEGRFRVDAPEACSWSASSGASWVGVDNRRRTGGGEVTYIVQTNPTPDPRSTSITVSGEGLTATHNVRQEAGPRLCTFQVAPARGNFSAAGGEGNFQVNAQSACLWSATVSDPWISLRPGSNYGTGSTEVAYTVAPNNTGAPRLGRITVAGQVHEVSQSAVP